MSKHRFGKCVVEVWKNTAEPWHPYPWRFTVQKDGQPKKHFGGIPNQCETKHSALMRGWWRAKWINDGTFNTRYGPF